MVYITVECMNGNPHKAHSWREGFLWLRKRECFGVPEKSEYDNLLFNYCQADVDVTTALYLNLFANEDDHRHNYAFKPEKSDEVIMIWQCLDPFCNKDYARFRSLFNYQTRPGSKMNTDIFMRSWR